MGVANSGGCLMKHFKVTKRQTRKSRCYCAIDDSLHGRANMREGPRGERSDL